MKKLYSFAVKVVYWLTWPATGLLLHNSKRVRVYVTKSNQLLLQKTSYSSQKWSLPGGGVERNESPLLAAVRELEEETGLTIDKSQFKEIGTRRVSSKKISWPKMNVTFFMVDINDDIKPKISRPVEIIDLKWFDLKSLPKNISPLVEIAQEEIQNHI